MAEQTMTAPPATTVDATRLSFKEADFAADMARLAAEQGVTLTPKPEAVQAATPPTPPAQPTPELAQAAATTEATMPVAVPDKFKTPDGNIDTERLAKSTVNVEEALASYLAKEKELKRKMNEVRAQENAYINPPAAIAPAQVIPTNASFAALLDADIAKDGAGVVLAKLFTAAQESVEERVQKEISTLKSVNADNITRRQVEAIGKVDPWVFTPEGHSTLTKVLESQPYLLQAPDPYKAAYLLHKGSQNVVSQSNSQVLTPTPIARPSAPMPTGQAASQTHNPIVKLETREDIDKHLSGLTPAQQSEFYVKMGYPAFKQAGK